MCFKWHGYLTNCTYLMLQNWSHGYEAPALIERVSHRGLMSAESNTRRSSSSTITYRRSSTASTTGTNSRSPPSVSRKSKGLEDVRPIPPPPLRVGSKQSPLPLRDSSVDSRRIVRDVSVDSSHRTHRDASVQRKRLTGKIPYGDPNRRERSVSRSSVRDASNPSSLEKKLDKYHSSRGRSVSKSRSSRTDRHRSSSRHSHMDHNSSSKSLGQYNTKPLTRRHSTEATSSKSVCNTAFSRRDSAPMPSTTTSSLKKSTKYSRQVSNERDVHKSSSMRRMSSKQSNISGSTESITSSEEDQQVAPRGRSLFSPNHTRQSRSKSKSRDTSCDRSFFSRVTQRGRSKSKSSPREDDEDKSIFSAGRSFANSITRRRSLSRNASRVLKITESMDGNKDVEPNLHRYEVPFNPSTGACIRHPECMLAVRNRGGGWRIVSDGCPICHT